MTQSRRMPRGRPAISGLLLHLITPALSLFALIVSVQPALALQPDRALTQYVQRIWQTQQGLPEAPISDIIQAKNGYLWIATEAGLVRFDGVRFTPVEQLIPDAPAGLFIRTAVVDAQGTFWLASNDTGVYALSDTQTQNYGQDQGLPTGLIWCLEPSKDGSIWVCSEYGLARIVPTKGPVQRGDRIQVLHTSDGLAGESVRAVCEDNKGDLWVGGAGSRLSVRRDGKFSQIALQGLPPVASVRSLVCDGETVWVGTTYGLVRLRGDEQELLTVADGLVDNFILSLAPGADGTLWIGTRSGFSRLVRGYSPLGDDAIDSFQPQDGLSQSSATSIFEDREGSLWVGTKRGLNQFVDGRSVPFTTREGLPSNAAGPVLQDSDGTIWAGTLDAGLARYDGRKFSSLTMREGLPSDSVSALLEDSDHSLLVGTKDGLARIRDHRVIGVYRVAQGLPSNDIRALYRDRKGYLWVGTAAGLASFSGTRLALVDAAPKKPIRALGEDKNGNLVVAIDESISVADGSEFMPLTPNGVYMRNANAIYLDPDGLLWIGLNGAGLRLINGNKISLLQTAEGLPDAEIYGIVAGDATSGGSDRLWLSCSSGVFWVSRSEVLKFAAGQVKRITSGSYTPTDALRVIEGRGGVQPSLWKMRDGRIWFPTRHGFFALTTSRPPRTSLLPLVIENPIVNGAGELPSQIAALPGGQKNIAFNYGGLSYVLAESVHFRYRLDGYDQNWIEAGNRREAFYTNLPPGDFKFRVTACAEEIPCNQQEASVQFTLTPLFYQRPWFWPSIGLLVGAMTWLAYQLHIRRLRERYDLIVSERSRIARELHDTLIQGFSGITMALQGLKNRLKSPDERQTLEEIIADAATCLTETRQSVAGLRAVRGPESTLGSTIERAVREVAETKNVRLKFSVGQTPRHPLPAEIEYNLLRILSEATTNAVKHSGASTIEVTVGTVQDALRVSISDDGVGFVQDEHGLAGAGHYGLIGMRERANQIGADLEVVGRPGGGTIVKVVLPVGRPSTTRTMETAK